MSCENNVIRGSIVEQASFSDQLLHSNELLRSQKNRTLYAYVKFLLLFLVRYIIKNILQDNIDKDNKKSNSKKKKKKNIMKKKKNNNNMKKYHHQQQQQHEEVVEEEEHQEQQQ